MERKYVKHEKRANRKHNKHDIFLAQVTSKLETKFQI